MAFFYPNTVSLLDRCSSMDELKHIHACLFKTGLISDTIIVSKLLAAASSPKSGNLMYAQMVFDRISKPNTFMWNALIRGYAYSNKPEQALFLYEQMLSHSAPHNSYTFPFLLKACSGLSALKETQQIHAHVAKLGFDSEAHSANSLLHAYAKLGSVVSARLLFDRMAERDIVSWNSMVDAYAKSGNIETAYDVFKHMPDRNDISWTTMISGFVQAGLGKEALDLFQEMQIAGVKPDNVVLASALSACALLGSLDQGRWIHAFIKKNRIQIDTVLACALADMYAKSGSMEEALEVFENAEKKDVSIWTAIIFGFAIHGKGRIALHWFMQMQKSGIRPNMITFTAILTGCSYAGLVEEGKSLFESMTKVYGLTPSVEHYGCMVDLLGRARLLKEAESLLQKMPVKPNAVILGTMLNACLIHQNLELGKQIGNTLVEVDPDHGGRYIHLARIHGAAREWDLAAEARKKMTDSGIKKLPGCSTISVNGAVHAFYAADGSHPQMNEIYKTWKEIDKKLRLEGYEPATRGLLLDIEDERKGTAISQHSEKLAVTFGLISTKPESSIRIFKNLRVCEDCHTVMKLVSKIYNRKIIMRDRTRFHVFNDGTCTCDDYW